MSVPDYFPGSPLHSLHVGDILVIKKMLFLGFVLLAGCGQFPKYEHPTAPSAATLTLINRSGDEVHVFGYADAAECKDPMSLTSDGKYLNFSEKPAIIRLRTNEPFTMQISLRSVRSSVSECYPVGTLIPKDGANYIGTISISGTTCVLSVNRVENGVVVPEKSFIPRVRKTPFSGSFSACADKFTLH